MRDTQLDGLRGLAALGIVVFHAHYGSAFNWMWTFVDLFFVLSGFLITRIVIQGLESGTFSLRNFMIRRVLRIWPVYYLVLSLCSLVVVANYLSTGRWEHTSGLMSAPFFFQFTHHYLAPGFNAGREEFIFWFHHSWSIAVEEQFYLLMPLLLLALKRRLQWAVGIVLLLIPVAVTFRWIGAYRWLLVYRMDALCVGVGLAFYWVRSRSGSFRLNKLLAALVLVWGGVLISLDQGPLDISRNAERALSLLGFDLVFGVVLLGLLDGWSPRLNSILSSRVLVLLGSISYALYLVHVPVRGVLLSVFHARKISDCHFIVQWEYFFISISLAVLSRVLIENRVERLKHRFPVASAYAQSDAQRAAAAEPQPAPDYT